MSDGDRNIDEEESESSLFEHDTDIALKMRVYENLNSIFGNDLANLSKVNHLQESLHKKLVDLDAKLDVANTSAPNQVHLALREGQFVLP